MEGLCIYLITEGGNDPNRETNCQKSDGGKEGVYDFSTERVVGNVSLDGAETTGKLGRLHQL